MIPQSLAITNFMSYRDTVELDLNGIHLACIAGANGAGKSTILEAMTWALFGKSRTKSDDDVVNRVAALQPRNNSAEVRLTFTLEDQTYRVIRSKKVGGRTNLDFHLAVGDGNWKPLSEGRLRETQQAIEETLRMNYETFTSASFLLQGKADEFTTKTAAQRKEVLAELLGVTQWEQYRDVVTNRRKESENELMLLDARLSDYAAELTEQDNRAAALATARAESRRIAEQLDQQELLVEQLRRTSQLADQQRKAVAAQGQQLDRARRRQTELEATQTQRRTQRDAYQAIVADAETIAAAFAAFQQADAAFQAWQDKANAHSALERERRPFELALERTRSRLQQTQAGLEAQAQRVATMRDERETVQAERDAAQARLDTLGGESAELTAAEADLQAARSALQQAESDRKLRRQEQAQLQGQADEVALMRGEREQVAANLAEADTAVERLAVQMAELADWREQLTQRRAEKEALSAEQPRLKIQMEKLHARIQQLEEEQGSTCPLCGQPLSDDHRRDAVAALTAEGTGNADRYRAIKARLVVLEQEIGRIDQSVTRAGRVERDWQMQQQRQARTQARLEHLDAAIAAWESGEQAQRLAELTAQLQDQGDLVDQRAAVNALQQRVARKPAVEREQRDVQRRLSQAEARLAEIERAVAEWDAGGVAELAEVGRRLAADDYEPEARRELARLADALAAVGYDAAQHQQARAERDGLADAPDRYQALQQARAALQPLEDGLADLARQIVAQVEEVAAAEAQKVEAEAQLQALEADAGDVRSAETELFRLRAQQVEANRRVGAAEQRLKVLDEVRSASAALTAERGSVTLLIQRLKMLEKACGRDGVQGLLIERALPEIEDNANDILDRLTSGRMRVSFETQRTLKSRDATIETLDIRINDDAGERPYENYSGGEQFRINFAIRLALSRILAKRANARLQTLVIDEGFGSQDPDGRQRLIEAINTIQDDFARILVITHVDELRDAFPARIEVSKTAAGSRIDVF